MPETGTDHAVWITKLVRPERGGPLRRDDARNLMRRTLELYSHEHRLSIHGWAVLPARVDLILALPCDSELPVVMGDVFGYYTRRFNARYRKSGALFRTKFLKKVLLGEKEILRALENVHRRARAVDPPLEGRPGGEPASSAGAYESGRGDSFVRLYPASPDRLTRTPIELVA